MFQVQYDQVAGLSHASSFTCFQPLLTLVSLFFPSQTQSKRFCFSGRGCFLCFVFCSFATVGKFQPRSLAHGCSDLNSSPVSQLAPPTRPATMGKRAQLLGAAFTPVFFFFFMLKKKVPFVSRLWHQASALWTPRLPLLALVVALVCWWGGVGVGAHISSGSVAEQRLLFSD